MIKNYPLKIPVIYVCLYIITYASMPVAVAATYQSHESIYQTARKFISSKVTSKNSSKAVIKIGKLDSRLKLKKCNKYLQAFLPKGGRELV